MSRTLKTWGLSEAKVDEMVAPFLKSANPTLALYAKADGINLRITAKAAAEKEAGEMLAQRERDIRDVLDKYIWGADSETLDGIIGKMLLDRKLTIATAETFTGGLLAHSFTTTPGSQKYFKGGMVLPVKEAGAGDAAALEIAETARRQLQANIGLAIVGEGITGVQVKRNAFIAAAAGGKREATATGYPGNPQLIARRTINHALVYLSDFIEGLA